MAFLNFVCYLYAVHALLSCPKCSDEIIKSVGADVKVRSKVTVFRDGGCFAICKGCGHEVAIPLTLDTTPLVKSASATHKKPVHLYIDPEYISKKT